MPGAVVWPGTVAAGSVTDTMVSTMDIFPTALAAAGTQQLHIVLLHIVVLHILLHILLHIVVLHILLHIVVLCSTKDVTDTDTDTLLVCLVSRR
jgi:hypothetical protein